MSNRLTPLAALTTLLLTIPGFVVGGIAAWIYRATLMPVFEGTLFNWVSGGWFETLSVAIFPNAVHGFVAGFAALWLSSKILRRSNYKVVAYAVSAIVIAFSIIGALFGFAQSGINLGLLELAANSGGLVCGLYAAYSIVRDEQARPFSTTNAGADTSYLAVSNEEKLITKIEENIDLREIRRLLEITSLDAARASDGITPIVATMRYVGGNYQNGSRRYRILQELAHRLPKERLVPALNARDKNGWTALMHAAAQSDALGGALLIHLGADPALKNDSGQTAADISARWPSVVPIFEGRNVPPSFPKLLAAMESNWP